MIGQVYFKNDFEEIVKKVLWALAVVSFGSFYLFTSNMKKYDVYDYT